jgi:hypothetical protein
MNPIRLADDLDQRVGSRIGFQFLGVLSAVPVAVPYANLTNPQTLNLYSMVGDDPESFADLYGHCWNVFQSLCNLVNHGHWVDDAHLKGALQKDADQARQAAQREKEFKQQWSEAHGGKDFDEELGMWLTLHGAAIGYVGGQIEPEAQPTPAPQGEESEPPSINWGQQEKHFEGHNSYTQGRSTLSANPEELVQKAGTGQAVNNVPRGQPGFKERVDFGKVIGKYIDPNTGVSTPTTKGIINYSKNGIHIVPARP